jgi:hypothetical protein
MNNDNLNISELYKALQEIFRLNQEKTQLEADLLNRDLQLMHTQFQLKVEKELLAHLKEIHFGSSVQKEAV